MGHYARLLSYSDAERLRDLLAKRLTRKIVERCGVIPSRPSAASCATSAALARMWRDPD